MNDDTGVTAKATIAWGILFIVFVAMTDMPLLANVGAMFAWLFFLSVLYKYGQSAFRTVSTVNTGSTRPTTAGGPQP